MCGWPENECVGAVTEAARKMWSRVGSWSAECGYEPCLYACIGGCPCVLDSLSNSVALRFTHGSAISSAPWSQNFEPSLCAIHL
jgi:hypothetical protein